jgi:hypothetical protein
MWRLQRKIRTGAVILRKRFMIKNELVPMVEAEIKATELDFSEIT